MEFKFNEKNLDAAELNEVTEELDEMTAGGDFNTWHTIWSSVISHTLGNNGYVCTWTTECQEKC